MTTAVAAPHQSADACKQSLRHLQTSGLVRLDDEEIRALAAALEGVEARSIEFFGSRTDPAGRGGDIDILIFSTANRLETARHVSTRFFMLCEERIDVVVFNPEKLSAAETAFLQSLRRVRIA